MPRKRSNPGARRRRQEEDDAANFLPVAARGHHHHVHELHGFEQVIHLRRRHRAALGYIPREP